MLRCWIAGLPVVALCLVSGCASNRPDLSTMPAERFAGYLTRSEKGSWFHHCGAQAGDAPWRVTFADDAIRQVEAASATFPNDKLFVRWTASKDDSGGIGPGARALLVRRITEIRQITPKDCEGAGQMIGGGRLSVGTPASARKRPLPTTGCTITGLYAEGQRSPGGPCLVRVSGRLCIG